MHFEKKVLNRIRMQRAGLGDLLPVKKWEEGELRAHFMVTEGGAYAGGFEI